MNVSGEGQAGALRHGKLSRRLLLVGASAAALDAVATSSAFAQTYPERDLRLIVPYAAGAGTDAVSRIVAQQLAARLGKAVVVENRTGANGNIGTGAVARAEPDGYTIGTATPGPVAVGRSLYRNLPYDPLIDLAPIVLINVSPVVILVHPGRGIDSASDLIARARAAPDTLNAAIAANGSINHLVTELFEVEAKAPLKNVPYAGGAQAVTDAIAGHVDLVCISLSSVVGVVAAGQLRPIAIASPTRSPLLPGVPTTAEIGVPAVVGSQWNGLVAPAKTARAVIERLNRAVREVLELSEVKATFLDQGMLPAAGSPEEFGSFIRAEAERWADTVRRAGVRIE